MRRLKFNEGETRMQQTEFTLKKTVEESMLAVNVGSGTLKVLATPVLAALFENAALQLAAGYLAAGQTTVGVSLQVEHQAPTPVGATVTVTARLQAHTERSFEFVLEAADAAGIIATGSHRRVAVAAARFQEKAEGRRS